MAKRRTREDSLPKNAIVIDGEWYALESVKFGDADCGDCALLDLCEQINGALCNILHGATTMQHYVKI